MSHGFLVAGLFALCACATAPLKPEITVAAAANLTEAFAEIAQSFETDTAIHVVHSFASTADLARQVENSAPFDVFAAADVDHIRALDERDLLTPGSIAIYARGQLALWSAPGSPVPLKNLADLAQPAVRFVAIAKPELAPYGSAAVEALTRAGLWTTVQPKVVYAENINMAKQYAATHNADASFTAYSLVLQSGGNVLLVDEKLHAPIDQALAILQRSPKQDLARRYRQFVLGPKGRAILTRYGYLFPPS